MKPHLRRIATLAFGLPAFGLALFCGGLPSAAEPPPVTVRPQDGGAALENPGMGWVFHYYDNIPANYGSKLAPSDTLDDFPGLTVIYLRIPWSYLEPEEGRFAWSVLDTPAQRWIAKGKQIALRISCCESWMRYATPAWVEKAGAKGYNFRSGKGVGPGRPVLGARLRRPGLPREARPLPRRPGRPLRRQSRGGIHRRRLVRRLGRGAHASRARGSSIRPKRSSSTSTCTASTSRGRSWRPTTISPSARTASAPSTTPLKHGLTLRDDSILVQAGAQRLFPRRTWPSRSGPPGRSSWRASTTAPPRPAAAGRTAASTSKAIEEYHASYVSIHWWPREFLDENKDLIARMNRRLGYRLQLVGGRLARSVPGGRDAARLQPRGGMRAWRRATSAGIRPSRSRTPPAGSPRCSWTRGLTCDRCPSGRRGRLRPRPARPTCGCRFSSSRGRTTCLSPWGRVTGTPRIALPLDGGDAPAAISARQDRSDCGGFDAMNGRVAGAQAK